MEAPLFSIGGLFGQDEEHDEEKISTPGISSEFAERTHAFPGTVLLIREFAFHEVNANFLWPGTLVFAQWLVDHQDLLHHRRILELGSGTGALAIFLKRSLDLDITTSDYDDEVIEENIAYNCLANGLPKLPHVRHVKQYANLIKSLNFLLQNRSSSDATCEFSASQDTGESHVKVDTPDNVMVGGDIQGSGPPSECIALPNPCFLMSWRRRLPKEDEALFFNGCRRSGLSVKHLGSRVYCIFKL